MSLQIAHVLDSISRSGRCGPLPIASGNNAAPAREAQAEVTRRKDKQGTLPCGIVPTMFGRIDSFGMDVGWAGGGGGSRLADPEPAPSACAGAYAQTQRRTW